MSGPFLPLEKYSQLLELLKIPTYKFALTKEVFSDCEETEFLPEQFLPSRAEDRATGWDVRCAVPQGLELKPGCYYKVPLGIRVLSPKGWWLALDPRSSIFAKRHLHALYGKIDETYPDQIFFACQYIPDSCELCNCNHPKRIEFGDRIGQLIPVRRQEMIVKSITNEELDQEFKNINSVRQGGFGSTGTN